MSDTPLADALRDAPHNELLVEAGASQKDGAGASITLEREKGGVSGGIVGSVSKGKGWGIAAFFRKVWK